MRGKVTLRTYRCGGESVGYIRGPFMTKDELRSDIVKTLEEMKQKAIDMNIEGGAVAKYGIARMKDLMGCCP